MKTILIDNTNKTKLSEETRTLLALRDTALQTYKSTPNQDNLREYKSLKKSSQQGSKH